MSTLQRQIKARHLLHVGLLATLLLVVIGNSLSHAQALTAKLTSANAASVAALDPQTTATVVASVASDSNLLVASEASQAAKTINQETPLVTSDPEDLAKRQVVSTAGNATRDITNYVVQPGDTLSTIATQFNVTTDTLLWANGLTDANAVKPGQTLVILPVSGLLYTVVAGDTAASLASQFNANAAQILSYNDDEMTGLTPGQKIIIPDGSEALPAAPAAAAAPAPTPAAQSFQPVLTNFSFSGNGYSYGYCTWYVASRRAVPSDWGDAVDWYYNAQASGFSVGSVPVAGAIAWTGAGYYGHVAIVDSTSGGMVTISEMNGPAGWGKVDTRTVPASSFQYIY